MEVGVQNDHLSAMPSAAPSPQTSTGHHAHHPHIKTGGNTLHLSLAGPDKAMKIFNREMHGSLNLALARFGQKPMVATETLSPQNFVKKALNYLEQPPGAVTANTASQQGQMQNALIEGLQNAKENLRKLNLLSDDLANAIDSASASIPMTDSMAIHRSEVSAIYREREINRISQLQIETQDGDVVTIDIRQSQWSSSLLAGATGETYQAQNMTREKSMSQSLLFRVDGELDAEEQQTVAELVQKVGNLADKFFEGDVDKAFNHAMKLGFDGNAIAGFSLALSEQRTEQTVAAKQITTGSQPVLNDALATMEKLAGFVLDFARLSNDQNAALLAQPEQALGSLLNASLLAHPESDLDPAQTQILTYALVNAAQAFQNTENIAEHTAQYAEAIDSLGSNITQANASNTPAATAAIPEEPVISLRALAAVSTFAEVRSMYEMSMHESPAPPPPGSNTMDPQPSAASV